MEEKQKTFENHNYKIEISPEKLILTVKNFKTVSPINLHFEKSTSLEMLERAIYYRRRAWG